MALFSKFDPKLYTTNQKEIVERMNQFYADSITINQSFWSEADIDTRFEAGDQALWGELYGNIPFAQRKTFNFNRIRRVINMISGHQRRNRKSTIVTPVENGDQETADQFTEILYWINSQTGLLNTISDAFHGALVTGLNLLQVWVDYRSDPVSGDIKIDNCSYNSFIIDPFFRKSDLSDCNAIWKRSYLTHKECASLLPEMAGEIFQMSVSNESRDGKFEFLPEHNNVGPKNLLTYDEFYYKDYRKQKMLVDAQTGETFEWKHEEKDEKLKEFLNMYPQVTLIEQDVPTVRVAILVQKRVVYDGPNPMGTDSYPFVPVFGYFRPQLSLYDKRIQGVVRSLRDAQYLYNRRKIIELDILESQVNSGWVYKEDALVNPKDVFLSGQGRGLALKQDAQMTDVQRIDPPQIPPSMMQLSELLAKEVQEISGVNEELLGSAHDDKAGILSMLRQGAGLTTLQDLFDNLDQAQKLLGSLMIDIIQTNFAPGKIKRITEEEPSPQFYHKAFGKYDAAIEEGLNTTTQRQMQFAQLLHLRETGVPVPDEVLINAATLQDKNELIKAIDEKKQQEAQAQQMQMQAAMEEQQARTELAHSRSVADQGLGLERLSRIKENQALAVERRAEAVKDRTAGVLNIAKALQEIEGADLGQLEQVIKLIMSLKDQETKDAGVDNTGVDNTGVDNAGVIAGVKDSIGVDRGNNNNLAG